MKIKSNIDVWLYGKLLGSLYNWSCLWLWHHRTNLIGDSLYKYKHQINQVPCGFNLGMHTIVAGHSDSSTWEAEVGWSLQVLDQPGLHNQCLASQGLIATLDQEKNCVFCFWYVKLQELLLRPLAGSRNSNP